MDIGAIATDVAVRARELKRHGRFSEARDLLLEAFAILPSFHPDRKRLYRGLGKILLALGDHDGAVFSFLCDFDASVSTGDQAQVMDSLFWLGIASVNQYSAHRSSNLLGVHASFAHDRLEAFSDYVTSYVEANRSSTYPNNIVGEEFAGALGSLSPALRDALQCDHDGNNRDLTCLELVVGLGYLTVGSVLITEPFVSTAAMEGCLPSHFDLPFAPDTAERISAQDLRLPALILGMQEDHRLKQVVLDGVSGEPARIVGHNQVFQGQLHTAFRADEVIWRRDLTSVECSWLLETDCQGGAFRSTWTAFAQHGPACFRVERCVWDEFDLNLQFFTTPEGRIFGGRFIEDDAVLAVLSVPSALIHIIGPELKP